MYEPRPHWILSPVVGIGIVLTFLAITGLALLRPSDDVSVQTALRADNLVVSTQALFGTANGAAGTVAEIRAAANQFAIDATNTQYQLTASDTIFDINTGGSNAPTTGAQIIRVGRHTTIGDYGSGGDTQIEGTLGNSATVVWQLSAQNYAELGRGWGIGPTWALLTGSVASSAGGAGVTSQPMIGLIGASSSTTTTLTFVYSDTDPAFRTTPTAIHCFATPDGSAAPTFVQVTGSTKVTSPPGGTVTFSCIDTTGAATACPAFFYTCWGAS